MSEKYFFHATAERMESEEYRNEDGDLDLEVQSPEEIAARMSASPSPPADAEASESKEEDSEMQDWLQIGPEPKTAENPHDDAESVTDPESGEEDNWFSIDAQQPGGAAVPVTEVMLCRESWRISIHLATPARRRVRASERRGRRPSKNGRGFGHGIRPGDDLQTPVCSVY